MLRLNENKNFKVVEDFGSLGGDKEEDDDISCKLLEQTVHVVEETTKADLQDHFLEVIDPSFAQIKAMVEKSSYIEFSFVVNPFAKYLKIRYL